MTSYQFFSDVCQLKNPELLQELVKETEVRYIKKGDFLVRAGEPQPDICFLAEGLLRGFFLDANGKDVTDCFAFQCGTAAMAFCPSGAENISPMNIELLEDGLFFCVPISLLPELQAKYPEVTQFYNRILIAALNEHWRMKQVLHQYTAMQRYQWFLEAYPGLVDRVSSKHIASFLGMSPVTLSRLRRTMREQQA
ncbi:MAG: Crp/Fnr family transcriptional regulator [Clostridiales bacterium]|nr:Crp/Fnr family transcriptional regulator [Clostridiales bacterium]